MSNLAAPRDMIIAKVHYKDKIGNVIIPETYGGKENVMEYYGEVISIGPECPFRNDLKVGDNILFSRNEGTTITDEQGNDFKSLKPRAVLCKDTL